MSLPEYGRYRDSEIPWLGAVPSHWTIAAVAYRYEVLLGKMLDEKRITGEHLAFYLRNADVQWDAINVSDLPQMDFSGDDLVRYSLRRGDLLVCEGGEPGRAAIWQGELDECFYQKALHRLRRRDALSDEPRFMFYLLRMATHLDVFAASEGKSTIAHLPAETLRRYRFCFPPQQEQQRITAFLDHETAKIDALVEEQKRLIDLLKEKRQAVISQAVTKGLDPSVPMKDSGVEWLGKVPAHWECITLRRCVLSVETGGTPSPELLIEDSDSGIPWYTPGDFTGDLLLSSSVKRVRADAVERGEAKVFPSNSVLIVSIGATLGKVALSNTPCSANQQVNAVIPGHRATACFLVWSLSVKTEVMRYLSNASTIGIMNQDKTKSIFIGLPPVAEQNAISDYLSQATAATDALVEAAQLAVDLLHERRSALISAAVTGKIDVRNLIPQPEAVPA